MRRRPTLRRDPRTPPARIMVVDDFEPTLVAVVETLRLVGYDVDGFQSSLAAREAIRTGSYDLVVTDYEMFGSTGLDLLTLVRNVSPRTPVILYSGSPAAKFLKAAVDRGAYAFLEKPLSMSVLVGRVKEALESRSDGPRPG